MKFLARTAAKQQDTALSNVRDTEQAEEFDHAVVPGVEVRLLPNSTTKANIVLLRLPAAVPCPASGGI
jgi:hypothetical protein